MSLEINQAQEKAKRYLQEHFSPTEITLKGAVYDEKEGAWRVAGDLVQENSHEKKWSFEVQIGVLGVEYLKMRMREAVKR